MAKAEWRKGSSVVDLELATTEQIVEELARRPLQFIFVAAFFDGQDRNTGLLGHTPDLEGGDALHMLHKAEEFFVAKGGESVGEDPLGG